MAEDRGDGVIEGSIVSNLRGSFALQNYEVAEENSKFQSDKCCAVCQASFGKIGIVHAKKFLCKFCNRGVCAKCSPEKLEHPTTKKEEKICSGCIERLMENHLSEDYKQKINLLQLEMVQKKEELDFMIKEKQMDMSYNQYIDQQLKSETEVYKIKLKTLNNSIKDLLDSQEGTRMNYKKLSEEHQLFIKETKKKEETIEALKENIKSLQTAYSSNKALLPDLRNSIAEMQELEFKLKAQIKEKLSTARSLTLSDKEQKMAAKLDELKHQIHVLEEEKCIFAQEIEKFELENAELDQRIITEAANARKKSNDGLVNTSSQNFSVDEEIRVRDLRERSKENQKTIQSLRFKLEAKNIFVKKTTMDNAATPDPGSRPCARCSII